MTSLLSSRPDTVLGVTSAGVPISRTRTYNAMVLEVASAERKAFSTLMSSNYTPTVTVNPSSKAHADAAVWTALAEADLAAGPRHTHFKRRMPTKKHRKSSRSPRKKHVESGSSDEYTAQDDSWPPTSHTKVNDAMQQQLMLDQLREELRQQHENRHRMELRMHQQQVERLCGAVEALERKLLDEVEGVRQELRQTEQDKRYNDMKINIRLDAVDSKYNQKGNELQRLEENYSTLKAAMEAKDKVMVDTVTRLMKELCLLQEARVSDAQERLTYTKEISQLNLQFKLLNDLLTPLQQQVVDLEVQLPSLQQQQQQLAHQQKVHQQQHLTIAPTSPSTQHEITQTSLQMKTSMGVQTSSQWGSGNAHRRTVYKHKSDASDDNGLQPESEGSLSSEGEVHSESVRHDTKLDKVVNKVITALRASNLLMEPHKEPKQADTPTSATPSNNNKRATDLSIAIEIEGGSTTESGGDPKENNKLSPVSGSAIKSPRVDHQVNVLQQQIAKLHQQKLDLENEEREYLAMQQQQRHQQWLRMLATPPNAEHSLPPPPPPPPDAPTVLAHVFTHHPPPQPHTNPAFHQPRVLPFYDNTNGQLPLAHNSTLLFDQQQTVTSVPSINVSLPPAVPPTTQSQLEATTTTVSPQPQSYHPPPDQLSQSMTSPHPATSVVLSGQMSPTLVPTSEYLPQTTPTTTTTITPQELPIEPIKDHGSETIEEVKKVKNKKKKQQQQLQSSYTPTTTSPPPPISPTSATPAPAEEDTAQVKKKGKKKKKVVLPPETEPSDTGGVMKPVLGSLSVPKTLSPLGGLKPLGKLGSLNPL